MPPALVVNGEPSPGPLPASASALLRARPGGAYTALLALGGELARGMEWGLEFVCRITVPHWQLHCERLATSLVLLAGGGGGGGPLPSFAEWHAACEPGVPLPLATLVDGAVLPSLRAAVRAVADGEGGGDVAAVVLLTEPHEGGGVGGGAGGAPAARPPDLPPVDVTVYAWPAPPPPTPAPAAVVGRPRALAPAKASDWAVDRAPLEAALPPGCADGLLADDAGCLVEGLVTNLFVVQEGEAPPGAGVPAGSPDAVASPAGAPRPPPSPGLVLRTSTPPSHPALDGVARRAVLAAAAGAGVAVDGRPPDPRECGAWREAFLTNAVRGVQPLTEIVGPAGAGGRPAWAAAFGAAPGPVTAVLAELAAAGGRAHATRLV